jgi:microcystin degradation protein MlrC
MRIVIAMMKHETNTFSPIVTDWERFQQWGAYEGAAVQQAYGGTGMPVAAYIKLAQARGAEIVTPVAAEAMPSGPVLEQAYEYMVGLICEAIASGCDAALLDLHGAMVAEHTLDGEGTLLSRIRDISPDLPIAVTCDLHCNLTADMVQNATALIGYKTYPHVDKYQVAEQIGKVVLDSVEGHCLPAMSWGNVPLLSQTLCQGTDDEPMKTLIQRCRDAEQHPEVLAATAFAGFAMSDMPDAGNSVVIVVDENLQLANQYRDQILHKTWETREQFVYKPRSLDKEIVKVGSLLEAPILLLDHADNCGSGGTQDVMTVIEAVFRARLADVIVGAVWDPMAVVTMGEAGVGAELTLDLGGKTDMPSIGEVGKPFHVTGKVKVLTDGKWVVRGPMYHGVEVDMGPTALFDTGNMAIVVVSHHHEPWDRGIFTSVGIQPEYHRYILLKSRIHYRAGFADLARHTVRLDGSGVTTSENSKLNYQYLRRPIYPLDSLTSY